MLAVLTFVAVLIAGALLLLLLSRMVTALRAIRSSQQAPAREPEGLEPLGTADGAEDVAGESRVHAGMRGVG
jgi:hypothetical protein